MKKLLAILCAVMLLATCSLTALAADDGKITITGVAGQTYNAYRIFDLKYSGTAYTYTVNADWAGYFAAGAKGLDYFTINDAGAVSAKDSVDLAEFAKLALAYAKSNGISAIASDSIDEGATTLEFTGLAYGYYLVDSSMGTLCALNTTDPSATISDKNAEPAVGKKVQEDDGDAWGASNTAELGQEVNFEIIVTAQEGAENYVLHDEMENLSLIESTVVVKNGTATLVKGTDYTLTTTSLTDGCSFEIAFAQTFCDTLEDNETITITYTATVDGDAVIGDAGNLNSAKLVYGENNDLETLPATTKTYIYDFDLVKIDDAKNLLNNAEFEFYKADKSTKVAFVYDETKDVYRLATAGEANTTTTLVVKDGSVKISGLDTDNYYLKETKAPEGYNLVVDFIDVKMGTMITGKTNTATITNSVYENGGVAVVNKSGSVLPDTGSFGTTVFVLVGGGLALFAAVLLVSKKRMANLG